jgi:hypothetical protein
MTLFQGLVFGGVLGCQVVGMIVVINLVVGLFEPALNRWIDHRAERQERSEQVRGTAGTASMDLNSVLADCGPRN